MNRPERPDTPKTRLRNLGLTLPAGAPKPIDSFCNARSACGMVYISGQGPVDESSALRTGTIGADVGLDKARSQPNRGIVATRQHLPFDEFVDKPVDRLNWRLCHSGHLVRRHRLLPLRQDIHDLKRAVDSAGSLAHAVGH